MAKFANVEEYLDSIADGRHRAEFKELLDWVHATWPQLVCEVKWNQPMFMDHGTFIIGFTALPSASGAPGAIPASCCTFSV